MAYFRRMVPKEPAPRVYPDTSTFGGTEDPEFMAPSRAFFEEVLHYGQDL